MNKQEREDMPYFIVLLLLFIVLIATLDARCTVTTNRDNSIGNVMYQDNPYMYKVGSVAAVGVVEDSLVIRIQPLATYSLFTEDILICGKPVEMFLNKQNPLVLTYRVKARRMVQGIGCHELVRVDELVRTEAP